jgi:hypothetical protein
MSNETIHHSLRNPQALSWRSDEIVLQTAGHSPAFCKVVSEALAQDALNPDPCPEDEEFLKGMTQKAWKKQSTYFWMAWRVNLGRAWLSWRSLKQAELLQSSTISCKPMLCTVSWQPLDVKSGSLSCSERIRAVIRARCYPFDMSKRRFHCFNPKVCRPYLLSTYQNVSRSY